MDSSGKMITNTVRKRCVAYRARIVEDHLLLQSSQVPTYFNELRKLDFSFVVESLLSAKEQIAQALTEKPAVINQLLQDGIPEK